MTEDEVGTLRASSVAMLMAMGALDVLGQGETLTSQTLRQQIVSLNRMVRLMEAEARQQFEPDTKRSNTSQELADTQQELRVMEKKLAEVKQSESHYQALWGKVTGVLDKHFPNWQNSMADIGWLATSCIETLAGKVGILKGDLDAIRRVVNGLNSTIADRDALIGEQSRSITELKQLLEAHQDARPVSPDDPIIASQQPQDAMDITPLLSPDTLASLTSQQTDQKLPDTGVTWVRKSTGHQYRIMGFAKADGCSVEHPLLDTQRVEVLPGCDGHTWVIRPHVKDEAGTRKVLKAIVQTAAPYTGEKPTTWVLYSDRVGGDWYARPLLEFCDRFQALHKV